MKPAATYSSGTQSKFMQFRFWKSIKVLDIPATTWLV